ncbi:glycohydrolase toxin TNT-related protein [Kitasatospora sp. NPDC058184]|uniref:glycohydrolase toxin TNT-related protein n=1 Tax=Kitasatospora sp. NPDC058184 TaxID=3346370 RepID=UPI0036DE7490
MAVPPLLLAGQARLADHPGRANASGGTAHRSSRGARAAPPTPTPGALPRSGSDTTTWRGSSSSGSAGIRMQWIPTATKAAPWFEQPGGATQFSLEKPVKVLCAAEYLFFENGKSC